MTTTAIYNTYHVKVANANVQPANANIQTEAIALVYRICQTLEEEGITYCHWKSNAALDRSARGDNDLDLLVSRADGTRFGEIMHRLGLKQAVDPPGERLPGVLSYYGYEPAAERLVHVHAHYQLVLGQDRTKNYRLPLEEAYLASAVRQGLFRVPSPEFELIVFTIRMVIKHLTWDAVLTRQGSLAPSEQQELVYLQSRVDWGTIQRLLAEHMPWIDVSVFEQAVEALLPGTDLQTRMRSGLRLQRQLATHSRRAPWLDPPIKLWRRVALKVEQRLMGRSLRKTPAHGGALIAVVGGDGSGKSTAVQGVYRWLCKDLNVVKVHLGKPPRSWLTLPVDAILKLERDLVGPRERTVKALVATGSPMRYVHMLRFVCTARDRYRAYRRAQRVATNGGLVICDRYPLPTLKMTDGPLLDQVIARGVDNALTRWMARIERHYSAQIMPPDLLIVLRVDPEIAVLRRHDEDAAWVRERGREIVEADWQQTPAHLIDAGQPQADVLAELKSLVWANL